MDTGDSIESTPALDVEEGDVVAIYTANNILNGGKNGVCTIRRLDALTGAQVWAYEVPDLAYASKRDIGVFASPVVGQGAIRDLVIFTATNDEAGAKVIALNKADGTVVWQTALESAALSSPVAIYNEDGDAWLIQAESNGKIHLMNAIRRLHPGYADAHGFRGGRPAAHRCLSRRLWQPHGHRHHGQKCRRRVLHQD